MSGLNELCKCSEKTVCNPKDHGQPISDVDECKQAALSLKKQFKDSRRRSGFPKGCYFLRDNANIYFNTHSVGRESRTSEQVCKFEQIKGKEIFKTEIKEIFIKYVAVTNFKYLYAKFQ